MGDISNMSVKECGCVSNIFDMASCIQSHITIAASSYFVNIFELWYSCRTGLSLSLKKMFTARYSRRIISNPSLSWIIRSYHQTVVNHFSNEKHALQITTAYKPHKKQFKSSWHVAHKPLCRDEICVGLKGILDVFVQRTNCSIAIRRGFFNESKHN